MERSASSGRLWAMLLTPHAVTVMLDIAREGSDER